MPTELPIARLAGYEMHLFSPGVQSRVEKAVCRGQHLTSSDQRTSAVVSGKTLNDIHSANRTPGPTIGLNWYWMIGTREK
jgi:hypothetical protein